MRIYLEGEGGGVGSTASHFPLLASRPEIDSPSLGRGGVHRDFPLLANRPEIDSPLPGISRAYIEKLNSTCTNVLEFKNNDIIFFPS